MPRSTRLLRLRRCHRHLVSARPGCSCCASDDGRARNRSGNQLCPWLFPAATSYRPVCAVKIPPPRVACPALPCCPTNGGSAKSVDLKNTGPLSCTGQHSNSFAFPYWSRVQSLVKTRFAQLLEQFTTLLVLLFLLGRDRPSSRQVVHVHKTKNTFTVVQCGTGHRAVLACWGTQTEGENAPGVSELCTNAQRFHCPRSHSACN